MNNFTITSFIADYYLEKTAENVGKIHAVENITADFPSSDQNHGITRTFLSYNQNGLTASQDTLNLSVTRNDATENIAKWDQGSYYLTAYLGRESAYVHGLQKYTLNYTISNIITNFSKDQYHDQPYQQLYWNTNGTGTTVPTEYLSASIHLPDSISKNDVETACYVGYYGNSNQSRCTTTKTTDGFNFSASNLSPGENLTFVVDFNGQQNFTIPEKPTSFIAVAGITLSVVVGALFIFLGFKGLWQATKEKRHWTKHTPVPPQYTPLKDITVAEMSNISLGKTKNPRVATLLELAVNHKIELQKPDNDKNWHIHVKSNPAELSVEQRAVLRIINGGKKAETGDNITIKKHSYSSELDRAQNTYDTTPHAHLIQLGAFKSSTVADNPYKRALAGLIGIAVLVAIAGTIFFAIAADSFLKVYFNNLTHDAYNVIGAEYVPFAIGFLVFSIIFIIGSWAHTDKYDKRTEKGLELDHYLRGLKMYIELAEQDRLNFLQSVKGADTSPQGIVKLYEKLLPYAALFGLEKSWMKELSRYYEQYQDVNHSWYAGHFVMNDFNRALRAVESSSSSGRYEPGSGSSGSGGGGFSGGGSGGGGVGGW